MHIMNTFILIMSVFLLFYIGKKISIWCTSKGIVGAKKFFTMLLFSFSFLSLILLSIDRSDGVKNKNLNEKYSGKIVIPGVISFNWSPHHKDYENESYYSMNEINEIIKNDLNEDKDLTIKILNEINTYSDESDRTLAKSNYINYGVSMKEYLSAIEGTNCRDDFKYEENLYRNANNSHFEIALSDIPKSMYKLELHKRDLANFNFNKNYREIQNKFNICIFKVIPKIAHLSRPKAKPLYIKKAILPSRLKCMRENNQNIDLCY